MTARERYELLNAARQALTEIRDEQTNRAWDVSSPRDAIGPAHAAEAANAAEGSVFNVLSTLAHLAHDKQAERAIEDYAFDREGRSLAVHADLEAEHDRSPLDDPRAA